MKVQVIYTSLTGCTKKLAEAIYENLPAEEKSIHDLKDGVPAVDGDIVLLGYCVMMGGPGRDMQELMKSIKGRAVGVFCTLGYYAESEHARKALERGIELVTDDNELMGAYVCNGAVAQTLKKNKGEAPADQKELRWEMLQCHPTEAECALAAERFSERVKLYSRCRELGIQFTPVL